MSMPRGCCTRRCCSGSRKRASPRRCARTTFAWSTRPSGRRVPYKPDVRQQSDCGPAASGWSLGIAFAVLRERADRTLQDPGDVTYYLGVPELGVVPCRSGNLLDAVALQEADAALNVAVARRRPADPSTQRRDDFVGSEDVAAGRIVPNDAHLDSLLARRTASVRACSC